MGIPAERLREGQQIFVRGKVSFSRIASLIDGPALQKRVEQEKARGTIYPTTTPHTTLSLVDAHVLPLDPSAPTQEETFVHEKIYDIKNGENAGKRGFGIDNKSTFLPTVLELDPENPGAYRQLVLERDLAAGMDVTLVIETYKPKGYEKRGLGLQQVVLNEEVRYYSSGALDTSALAARGIVVNGPIRSVSAAEAPVDSTAAAAAFAQEAAISGFQLPNTGADASGLPIPTPGAVGVAPTPSPAAQAFPQVAPAAQAFPQTAPAAAPLQQAPVAAPAAPAIPGGFPGETAEQTIARLRQQLEETQAAQTASGGESAFGGAPEPAVGGLTPWDVPGGAPAAFQG